MTRASKELVETGKGISSLATMPCTLPTHASMVLHRSKEIVEL